MHNSLPIEGNTCNPPPPFICPIFVIFFPKMLFYHTFVPENRKIYTPGLNATQTNLNNYIHQNLPGHWFELLSVFYSGCRAGQAPFPRLGGLMFYIFEPHHVYSKRRHVKNKHQGLHGTAATRF